MTGQTLPHTWGAGNEIEMAFVEGTRGRPFWFGEGAQRPCIEIPDFYIATVPVTEELWGQVMNSGSTGRRPKVDVSWDDITGPGGFLERINAGGGRFRLPSETEWEYAARGGPHWAEGFRFSGSNEIETVAWYDHNSGNSTHDVGLLAPNQLDIHDMSGNVWEWCQDCFTRDIGRIPTDGSALICPAEERVLRGGCHHNWAVHCAVSKRYEIGHQYHDGCIGFRLAASAEAKG